MISHEIFALVKLISSVMKNVILLQNVTLEQLEELIKNGVKSQLDKFKENLNDGYDELLTRAETCKFLKIDSSTLWAWTNKGKVKAYGIGNRRYYKKSELLEGLTLLKNQVIYVGSKNKD